MIIILEKAIPRLIRVCCKRMVYGTASMFAGKIVSGRSVAEEGSGEAASKVFHNHWNSGRSIFHPLYMPPIGFEKLESVDLPGDGVLVSYE